LQFGSPFLHPSFQRAVGGLQGRTQLQDLFGDGLIEFRPFDDLQIKECLSQQDRVAFGSLFQLIVERLLQILRGDQAFLNKILTHAGHKHFGGEPRRNL
jgi:hypothetical protein